ncbi:hypothetical protein [Streptomyces noursei]|nr:hypothetical protein [Streptomyces noursei]MCZ1013375.1 hypothetical protein [Streptomyces noursei]
MARPPYERRNTGYRPVIDLTPSTLTAAWPADVTRPGPAGTERPSS